MGAAEEFLEHLRRSLPDAEVQQSAAGGMTAYSVRFPTHARWVYVESQVFEIGGSEFAKGLAAAHLLLETLTSRAEPRRLVLGRLGVRRLHEVV